MTADELARATGSQPRRAAEFLPHIDAAMAEFGIDTPARAAMFLAQIGHESGGLRWLTEIWGPTEAQRRYEGRIDLGNTEPGDGFRFRGRGLIQITGRANYRAAGEALGANFIGWPERLAMAPDATRSAAWFWRARGLNELADAGNFERITRRINGGLNGYADRLARLETAREALA